jgi:GT2 family glycosyltransferase
VTALAVTLTSLCYQSYSDFDVVVSDQTEGRDVAADPSVQTVLRLLEFQGHKVRVHKHLPRQGIAEQREFLLAQSDSPYSLFLDDDLVLEPYVLGNMLAAITEEGCGFVGQAVLGLSYMKDVRPAEQAIELWEGAVQPEVIRPGTLKWSRHKLHNAANLLHVQTRMGLSPQAQRKYKVAWVGGCVLYDTAKLREVGGYSFWKALPVNHAGEDVLVQVRLMERFGGCGLIPSGVYHQELTTTLPDRRVNATDSLLAPQEGERWHT